MTCIVYSRILLIARYIQMCALNFTGGGDVVQTEVHSYPCPLHLTMLLRGPFQKKGKGTTVACGHSREGCWQGELSETSRFPLSE